MWQQPTNQWLQRFPCIFVITGTQFCATPWERLRSVARHKNRQENLHVLRNPQLAGTTRPAVGLFRERAYSKLNASVSLALEWDDVETDDADGCAVY
jgi:hypothetical protein